MPPHRSGASTRASNESSAPFSDPSVASGGEALLAENKKLQLTAVSL
jgi:hypothetical protein